MRAKAEPLESVLNRSAERVVRQVPTVGLAQARGFVSRATRGPGLRQLESHLRVYPDSLTSGSSIAPAPVQVLAALLAEAGHGGVRIPECLRCGGQKPLPNRVDGGSICNRCRHLTHLASCGDCGKTRPINTRDEQGQPLCASCSRARKHRLCNRCGQKDGWSDEPTTGLRSAANATTPASGHAVVAGNPRPSTPTPQTVPCATAATGNHSAAAEDAASSGASTSAAPQQNQTSAPDVGPASNENAVSAVASIRRIHLPMHRSA